MGLILFVLFISGCVASKWGQFLALNILSIDQPLLGQLAVFAIGTGGGLIYYHKEVRAAYHRTRFFIENRNINVRRQEESLGPPTNLQGLVASGKLLIYRGLVDRDFHYTEERLRSERVCTPFELRRNTLAMAPREREATEVMMALDWYGLLGTLRDDLRFAVIYGDGKSQVFGPAFTVNNKILQQHGIRSIKALVAHEAEARGLSFEAAVTDLYNLLLNVAAADSAPAPLKDLLRRHLPVAASKPTGDVEL